MSIVHPALDEPRIIYTVSELNYEARELLESNFPLLWVEGELTNVARPTSGHLYFTLKDAQAQVRCAMFRSRNQGLQFEPHDGVQALVRARVSLYENRGEFQLVVEHMEEAGYGALQREFEAVKRKLAAEGLFDDSRKQTLPVFPKILGIITSPSGAALQDILNILRRRYPLLHILVYPVSVQGENAPREIAAALQLACRQQLCELLIVTRGGGSLEDLWAFNDEGVARAIASCGLPVVSAIGHEIDFTIADFVADLRAATPSAAAELVSPNQQELSRELLRRQESLQQALTSKLQQGWQRMDWLEKRLQQLHPVHRLRRKYQRLSDVYQRLQLNARLALSAGHSELNRLHEPLQRASPQLRLQRTRMYLGGIQQRLVADAKRGALQRLHRLQQAQRGLHAYSPLATLNRGYAIVTREADGGVVSDSSQVNIGERISARLAQGSLSAEVKQRKTPR